MGKASRIKRENRAAGIVRGNRGKTLVSMVEASRHECQADSGPQSVMIAGDVVVSVHEALLNAIYADDAAELEIGKELLSVNQVSVLDFMFNARGADGAKHEVTIYHQAWMEGAFRCLKWLMAEAADFNHAGFERFLTGLFAAFRTATPRHPRWEDLHSALRALVEVYENEGAPEQGLDILRELGDKGIALASRIVSERQAATERKLFDASLRLEVPRAASGRAALRI